MINEFFQSIYFNIGRKSGEKNINKQLIIYLKNKLFI